MKHLFIYMAGALLAGLTLAACSPEKFDGANQAGIPTVEGQDFTMTVDQEVNQVTVNYPETAGSYPIWIFNGATYSTLNTSGWSNTEAGTYTVEMRIGNRNGISQTGIQKTFTFNETKVDYSAEFRRITGKEWRIANKEVAHLACGKLGGDGSDWWKAQADEKKGTGMYDDRITFTADTRKGGSFTYNPGDDGLTYVNKSVTKWGGPQSEDFDAVIGPTTTSWYFEPGTWTDADGKQVSITYLVLEAGSPFPYISDDKQYNSPRFRVETLTTKKMVLVFDNTDGDGISWRFILTSEEGEKEFEGFDANSDFNLWKGITPTMEFWYAPGWAQIADPGFKDAGNDYTITLPEATTDQWQAQVKFHTELTTSASSNYDFSAIFNADKDLNGATVKLVLDGDDGVFYFTDRIDLKANEDYVFWKSDMPGLDMAKVMLVLDFGGCQTNTVVNVRNVVLKDHANDDGTVLPDQGGGGLPAFDGYNYDSNCNLFKTADTQFTFYYAPNWAQLADPTPKADGNGWTISLPEATTDQWQAQWAFVTNIPTNASTNYDFSLVLTSTKNHGRVTVKLTAKESDDVFYFADQIQLTADEDYVFYKSDMAGLDINDVKLVLDFGGNEAGTDITVKNVVLKEHGCDDGAGQPGQGGADGPAVMDWDYTSASNLWKAVDDGAAYTMAYYYAPGWAQIADPGFVQKGDSYEVTLPEATTDQWQAQVTFRTALSAVQSGKYNFYCVLESDQDHPGVTVKLTQDDNDDNYFFAPRVALEADEEYVFKQQGVSLTQADAPSLKLVFDFGGCAAGTHVKISKIYFEQAQ